MASKVALWQCWPSIHIGGPDHEKQESCEIFSSHLPTPHQHFHLFHQHPILVAPQHQTIVGIQQQNLNIHLEYISPSAIDAFSLAMFRTYNFKVFIYLSI